MTFSSECFERLLREKKIQFWRSFGNANQRTNFFFKFNYEPHSNDLFQRIDRNEFIENIWVGWCLSLFFQFLAILKPHIEIHAIQHFCTQTSSPNRSKFSKYIFIMRQFSLSLFVSPSLLGTVFFFFF